MSQSTAGGDWLTVAQAMAALARSDKSIRRMIERKDLRAEKVRTATGQEWRIMPADVARFAHGETGSIGQVSDTAGQVPDTAGSTAGTLDTRRMDRMEGYLAGQMDAAIARAVSTAIAPLIEQNAGLQAELRELRAIIEKLSQAAPEAAQGAPSTQVNQTTLAPISGAVGRSGTRVLRPWQRAIMRMIGAR